MVLATFPALAPTMNKTEFRGAGEAGFSLLGRPLRALKGWRPYLDQVTGRLAAWPSTATAASGALPLLPAGVMVSRVNRLWPR